MKSESRILMSSSAVDLTPPIEKAQSVCASLAAEEVDIQLIKPSDLSDADANRWREIRSSSERLSSPYLDVEFTKAVSRVRNDAEIALLRSPDGQICGILPFQRISRTHAVPVGGRLNDVHGLLGNSSNEIELLRKVMVAAGIKTFDFHAAFSKRGALDRCKFADLNSYYINLENGWDSYHAWLSQNSSTVRRHGQKKRALSREYGDLRFEFNCRNETVLESLIDLKRSKYVRTRTFDILSVDWAANLLREIASVDSPDFKGNLSALWAGDHLVAAHFGMISGSVLHYWFPAFAPEFAKFSPGTELILRVAEEAAARQISKVDFGYGDDPYKSKFCDGRENLACGQIGFSRVGFQIANAKYHGRQLLKRIPLKKPTKRVLRAVFPGFGQWNFK